MRRRFSLHVLLSISLLGTSVAVPFSANAETPAPSLLSWGPCPPGSAADVQAECADFTVPRNYSDPGGTKISLTMSRIAATGQRRGVIAGNPGGPGGDALGLFSSAPPGTPRTIESVSLPTDVREHFDLVAVEPRGLTWGTPLDCPATLSAMATAGGAFDSCESTNPGYTSTITTDNTARDLEEARKALGEEKLNLYGVSYGGILMATYATLFPSHTDRLLLDSSASPDQRWFGLGTARKEARRDGLNAMFSWLAEHDSDYHLGTTPLQVYRRWAQVTAAPYGVQLPTIPPSAQEDDLSPEAALLPGTLGVELTNDLVRTQWRTGTLADNTLLLLGSTDAANGIAGSQVSLYQGLYKQSSWPEIGAALHAPEAARARAADTQVSEEELADMQHLQQQLRFVEKAIICNENTVAPDPTRIPPALETAFTGGDRIQLNEDLLASGLFCAGWPLPTVPTMPSGVHLDRAPLSIGFTHDTAVTATGAIDMHRAMGGEITLVDGYSHGVLVSPPEEVSSKISAYFR